MNKDVIYIEPDDDITDVVTKISGSKERIIALVPPKKSNILRSAINIKLIARAGLSSEKTVVIVTTEPGIIKLAAASKLHVTKDLTSTPYIPDPTETPEIAEAAADNLESAHLNESEDDSEDAWIDKLSGDDSASEASNDDSNEKGTKNQKSGSAAEKGSKNARKSRQNNHLSSKKASESDSAEKEPEDSENDSEPAKSAKKASKSQNGFLNWLRPHKPLAIFLAILSVGIIAALVWAFVFAPAATVNVEITTKQASFSDNISFTTNLADEDVENGVFYLEEKTYDEKTSADFTATGKKNVGDRATGKLIVYYYFTSPGTIAINQGATFTYNGLAFTADETTQLSANFDPDSLSSIADNCENSDEPTRRGSVRCLQSTEISVTAAGAGSNYNGIYSNSGWATTSGVGVRSSSTTSGGTDKEVTVVQQSDIESAIASTSVSSEDELKQKLFDSLGDDDLVIESSFTTDRGDISSSPAVDSEADKGTVSFTTTAKVFVVDETKIERYIESTANLPDNEKIYDLGSPFIESFGQGSSGYVGKLKTSYYYGARTTESDVMDIVKGKKVGDAKTELQSKIENSTINIETSFPWVSSIPDDSNKITINIKTNLPASAKEETSSETDK